MTIGHPFSSTAVESASPYRAFGLNNFRSIPQLRSLSETQMFEIEVVGHVLPFKTNSYVIDELINWESIADDPIFALTFPQREMLIQSHFEAVAFALRTGQDKAHLRKLCDEIRSQLNPHPSGQRERNIPRLKDGTILEGMQHKYPETVLFFPSQGQTCHAYCSFCFRWPQFVGSPDMKFAMSEVLLLVQYLREHPEVTDVLFTGGDPMVMSAKLLHGYISSLLKADLPHLKTIRIGSKALSYWPYRFTTDPDAGLMLDLFREVEAYGKHLSFMAHFNHPRELETEAAKQAIAAVRTTGAQIRSQSPILARINANPETWATMWKEQVRLGIIPYYMFILRDTGAQRYFGVSLAEAHSIFKQAYQTMSGIARTVRGPVMSVDPGKIQLLGTEKVGNEDVMIMQFIQARNPEWNLRPFFTKLNMDALWLDDLVPAFGKELFFREKEELEGHAIQKSAS